MTLKIEAVIFDMAGTIVDYGSRAPAGAFVELYKRYGVDITVEKARGPMGMEKKDHLRVLSQLPDVAAKWKELNGKECTEADIDSMYAKFIPLQLECLPNYGDLIPGALETVNALREMDIRIGVTTGYNREMMETVLGLMKKQGLEPDSAVCAGDVAAGRPAPWMLFRCMEELGVYPGAAVLTIGDTIPDIAAGINAGVWSGGLSKTGNMLGLSLEEVQALDNAKLTELIKKAEDDMMAAGAHYVTDGVSDFVDLIETINGRLANGETP